MKPGIFTIIMFLAGACVNLMGQSYIPITDNMQIQNFSNIKFVAGNYSFTDSPGDGVIQINGKHNIVLDGDSCFVDGVVDIGYMIMITNSNHIVIKNFDSVFNYKYAVYIMNSDHITINGNDFSWNRVDSAGWIDVWTDYTGALGGGVMMYQVRAAEIFDNVMKYQNDGVALYHCDSINLHDNDFSWNTSYGIRMFWTDSCQIAQNNCSHVNRPETDPSDCAALLMIISNNNHVSGNDLTWSGDGVFLGQYQHSEIPNNNFFTDNNCSYSPHNAIEATFADGNVYIGNLCNYSHYGFWLGYSFNSLVQDNQIIGNFNSGIAIDRGFQNEISGNVIKDNPIGIELWEGSPIGGYTTWTSKDYYIHENLVEGNTVGISASKSEHSVITGNDFTYNQAAGISFDGTSTDDTIINNAFYNTTQYHLKNNSSNDIYSPGNIFTPNDSLLTENHIFDKNDVSSRGKILWSPCAPHGPALIQDQPPCDMAEPSAIWYAYPEVGYPGPRIPDTVSYDTVEKVVGVSSVKLTTGRGWDVALNYRPGGTGDSASVWSLTEQDTLRFWVRTIKQPQFGFQYFHIRIGNTSGGYYKYTASTGLLNAANLQWKQYKFPISGNSQFSRTVVGSMSADSISYIEFHADTWDYGFTLWVDGVQFSPCDPLTSVDENAAAEPLIGLYPNPFSGSAVLTYTLEDSDHIQITLLDMQGREIMMLADKMLPAGKYSQPVEGKGLKAGVYLVKIVTSHYNVTKKAVVAHQ